MKIFVTVRTGVEKASVEKIGAARFKVSVKARPEKGKANEAVIRALGKYFGLPSSRLKIISGRASRQKIILVE